MLTVNRWLIQAIAIIVMTVAGLGMAVHTSAPLSAAVIQPIQSSPMPASEQLRATGADMDTATRFGVAGTDLGIPYRGADGSIKFEFGDTFTIPDPAKQVGKEGWRAPVILRSHTPPGQPIVFDGAVGLNGDGIAPDVIPNGHQSEGEYSVIPTDGISFPETGNEIISYMSIHSWDDTGTESWQTNGAGLAWSPDGEHFYRIQPGDPNAPIWSNTPDNKNPFQMWTMARSGDFVYVVSVRAGRQEGPMMLQRVPWDHMLDKSAYQCFNGHDFGGVCQPIMWGRFGEPSLRFLADPKNPAAATWVLSYLDLNGTPQIVTQTAPFPTMTWSPQKVQVTWNEFPFEYGGFIRPDSTPDNLTLMVSTWRNESDGQPARYDVTPFHGSV